MERLPRKRKEIITRERYEDVTDFIIAQTQELREKEGQFSLVMPEGIFLLSPRLKVKYKEYFDYGCRGGHTEFVYRKLPSKPVSVCNIEGANYSYNNSDILIRVALPGEGLSESFIFDRVHMRLVRKIEVKNKELADDEEIKRRLMRLLEPEGFVQLDQIDLSDFSENCRPIYASSADPLSHPIMYRDERRSNSSKGPLKNQPIHSLMAVKTPKGVFAQIMTSSQGEETGWEPLEAFDFAYLQPDGPSGYNTEKHLAIIARRLLSLSQTDNLQGADDAINAVGQYIDLGLKYAVAENGALRKYSHFVFADSIAGATPDSPRQIANLRPANFGVWSSDLDRGTTIYADVSEVDVRENRQVWIHDKEAGLATPLSRVAFYLVGDRLSSVRKEVHLSEYIEGNK